jgi:ubiquinone biosynthesis protein COQ4
MDAIAHGWRLGRQARPFLAVRWAELWERPLAQVQAELGLPSAAVAPVARAA